jgi:hypothetical protein
MTWKQAKQPKQSQLVPLTVRQSTSKSAEAIVNSYGVNGQSFMLHVDDVPEMPVKFDSFTDANGEEYVIDSVIHHHERGSGVLVYFTCYSKGK